MYFARVYKIMIGAPSDIQEEIQIAKKVIYKWNFVNSERHRKVLLPLHWSDNAYPKVGKHPQKSIDEMVVCKSDLLICIFCSRLGSATDTHKSGSLEEIDEHLKAGKDVMIFFKKNSSIPTSSQDLDQMKMLLEYKESVKDKCLWWEYEDENCFESVLKEKLELYINDKWLSSKGEENSVEEEGSTLSLSKSNVSILCGSSAYIDVNGVNIDNCGIKVNDSEIAYATEQNSQIRVDGNKVGHTTLSVTYKNLKAECDVNVTPMYMLCGNPILEFGKDMEYINEECRILTHSKINEKCLKCREEIGQYIINHYYIFGENKLEFIVSEVETINSKNYSELYLEAYHCLNERYSRISSSTKKAWYQYKDQFYIVSIDFNHYNKWYFCYAPTKDIMDKKIEEFDML